MFLVERTKNFACCADTTDPNLTRECLLADESCEKFYTADDTLLLRLAEKFGAGPSDGVAFELIFHHM